MEDVKQLIDSEGNFLSNIETWIRERDLGEKGFDFSVVTVLGCQSSGKSTILNELFNTKFQVLDATKGRHQTTRGLWISYDQKNSILVIDVEGTDSLERGEDRHTFEHRAALFSLALADVVIVNMWYHDIGRYTASNYGLLKTVLGVNLELFQQQRHECPKTILLFIIRDYPEAETPLHLLSEMINNDIQTLWKQIKKPTHLTNSTVDEFFKFNVLGLPNYLSERTLFYEKCHSVRNRWCSDFRPTKYTRKVPIDGFAFYSKSVWETILSSSELDIPSQKEMLATFRCEELRNNALTSVYALFPKYLNVAQEGNLMATDFKWASNIVNQALEVYDKPACRYQYHIYEKKRNQLLASLQNELQKIIDAQLTHVRHELADQASKTLEFLLATPVKKEIDKNKKVLDTEKEKTMLRLRRFAEFDEITHQWKKNVILKLQAFVSETIIVEYQSPCDENGNFTTNQLSFDLSYAQVALAESLDALILRSREKQFTEFEKVLTASLHQEFEPFEVFYSTPNLTYTSFWMTITTRVIEVFEGLKNGQFYESYKGICTGKDMWETYLIEIIALEIRSELSKLCEWILQNTLNRFQQFFQQDKDGVPRQWQSVSDETIKKFYVDARDKALVLFELLDFTRVEPMFEEPAVKEKISEELVKHFISQLYPELFSDIKKHQLISRANRQMQQKCQEAQLIQATGQKNAHIPWWIWVLIFALGYNEMTTVLFSPFLLITLIVVILVLGISYYTNHFHLPFDLTRKVMGLVASALIPLLSTLQEGQSSSVSSSRDVTHVSVEKSGSSNNCAETLKSRAAETN